MRSQKKLSLNIRHWQWQEHRRVTKDSIEARERESGIGERRWKKFLISSPSAIDNASLSLSLNIKLGRGEKESKDDMPFGDIIILPLISIARRLKLSSSSFFSWKMTMSIIIIILMWLRIISAFFLLKILRNSWVSNPSTLCVSYHHHSSQNYRHHHDFVFIYVFILQL